MRAPLRFLIPSSSCLDEQHMDQTCLCSTIWWPPLWVRKPPRRWMRKKEKEKKINPYCLLLPFLSLGVIPPQSSGWCLSPVSSLLNHRLWDHTTHKTTTSAFSNLSASLLTLSLKTITLCRIRMNSSWEDSCMWASFNGPFYYLTSTHSFDWSCWAGSLCRSWGDKCVKKTVQTTFPTTLNCFLLF